MSGVYRPFERVGEMRTEFLRARTALSVEWLMHKYEASRATIKRDLVFLRDRLQVPVKFDRDLGGYVLERDSR